MKGANVAKKITVDLGDHFERFIASQVTFGRYGSASEVIRTGLRLLEAHEAQQEALGQAIIDGENSGPPQPFDHVAHRKAMLDRAWHSGLKQNQPSTRHL